MAMRIIYRNYCKCSRLLNSHYYIQWLRIFIIRIQYIVKVCLVCLVYQEFWISGDTRLSAWKLVFLIAFLVYQACLLYRYVPKSGGGCGGHRSCPWHRRPLGQGHWCWYCSHYEVSTVLFSCFLASKYNGSIICLIQYVVFIQCISVKLYGSPCYRIPPPSLSSKLMKIGVKVTMYGVLAFGVYKLLPAPEKSAIRSFINSAVQSSTSLLSRPWLKWTQVRNWKSKSKCCLVMFSGSSGQLSL